MITARSSTPLRSAHAGACVLLLGVFSPIAATGHQPSAPPPASPASSPSSSAAVAAAPVPGCTVDLALPGVMSDILSNALVQGLRLPESDVRAYLAQAKTRYATGPELLAAAAAHFKLAPATLGEQVTRYTHVNCRHGAVDGAVMPLANSIPADDGMPVSAFARDVTLHVVLHELGHAVIREFDLPILGNEETMADAFATHYLTTYLPERAADVLAARVTSLMIEAGESTMIEWGGEHDHDARRAHQIAALAIAADPAKYRAVGQIVGMSEDDARKARDYGSEIHRSWRRILAPLWMPAGQRSGEARVEYDEQSGLLSRLCDDGLADTIESAVRRIDWHSQVTVKFVDADGGARWSRSGRTITVHSSYVRRFIAQGERGLGTGAK